jgi:hypothetical protein
MNRFLEEELEEMGLSSQNTIAILKSDKKVTGTHIKTGEEFSISSMDNGFFVDILYPQRSGNPNLPLKKHYQNGNLVSELYGKIIDKTPVAHREGDKPAIVVYEKKDGEFYKYQESFYKDGVEYREDDKPEFLMYHENGNILCKRKDKLLKIYTVNGLFIETHIGRESVFSLYNIYSFLFELGFDEFRIV